jgi:hypothetical protein
LRNVNPGNIRVPANWQEVGIMEGLQINHGLLEFLVVQNTCGMPSQIQMRSDARFDALIQT